jgi:peroxiredoxin
VTGPLRRHPAGVLIAGALVAGLLAGCDAGNPAGSAAEPQPVASPVAGGAAAVPGPAPTDLGLRPAPTDSPPAPAVSGSLTDGSSLALADLWVDRAVVLTFVNSWCTTCAEQQDALSELARDHADRVAFVGVVGGGDDAGDVQEYLRRHGVGYPVLVDEERAIWRSYAVREPPAVVLIARGGVLLRGFPGGIDPADLAAHLAAL